MTWAEVGEVLTQVRAVCHVEPLTVGVHARGIEIAERYDLSIYDAMILASARAAGCATVHTEDMQNGQIIEGELKINNPFAI